MEKRFEDMDVYAQRDWALVKLAVATAEIGQLKNDLTLLQNHNFQTELRARFKLSTSEAQILDVMSGDKRRVLKRETIRDNMNTHYSKYREDILPKIIDVHICKIRQKLPAPTAIETVWGFGYRISDHWLEKLAEIRQSIS